MGDSVNRICTWFFDRGAVKSGTLALVRAHTEYCHDFALRSAILVDVLGEDAFAGKATACTCSTLRYEHGHSDCCPLNAYPREVLVVDSSAAMFLAQREGQAAFVR